MVIFCPSRQSQNVGGGGYSLILAIQVCAAPKGMVLRRFGLKTDIYFAHFGQCMNVFFVSSSR